MAITTENQKRALHDTIQKSADGVDVPDTWQMLGEYPRDAIISVAMEQVILMSESDSIDDDDER